MGADKATVQWKEPKEDGGSKVTGYIVKVKEEGTDTWKDVAKLGVYDKDYTVKELTPGKSYDFEVVAENKAGEGTPAATDKPVTPRKKPGRRNR